MIKKALLTFVFFLFVYTAFVAFVAPRWWQSSQHQWQDNFIRAQNFMYDTTHTIQNVIVGSSLSVRIVTNKLPSTYNLSFGGQSLFDGLDILEHKTTIPNKIYIEMNLVQRGKDDSFLESLNTPLLFYARKHLPSLREDKQPIGVMGVIFMVFYRKLIALFKFGLEPEKEMEINDSSPNGYSGDIDPPFR